MSIEGPASAHAGQRDRGTAEPARYVLLGLLVDSPAHGYDLSRHFISSSALGDVIRLSPSHLYALLARLERDGLVVGEMHSGGSHPQRRVYRLTSDGREAVQTWADVPVGHPRDMRIDFPLKLYIARMFGDGRVEALIARQRDVFHRYIAQLHAQDVMGETSDDTTFLDLMRLGRIGRAQAALDWLDLCAKL